MKEEVVKAVVNSVIKSLKAKVANIWQPVN